MSRFAGLGGLHLKLHSGYVKLAVLSLLIGLALGVQDIWQIWRLNWAARQTLAALLSDSGNQTEVQAILAGITPSNCHAAWLQGHVDGWQGDSIQQDQSWHTALMCDASYAALLAVYFPARRDWAEEAVRRYPQSAEAWFWLARTYLQEKGGGLALANEADRSQVIVLYQQGLTLAPDSGLRWCQLGGFLRPVDAAAALQAFSQCCFNGDPGSNGCYNAGLMAEAQGDLAEAIGYYRRSRMALCQQRAHELQLVLRAGEP